AAPGKFGDLKRRLMFLLGALIVYRIGAHIPVPGIDPVALADLFKSQKSGILGVFNLFSGGALSRFTIFALGIMPYISASIILMLLGEIYPPLRKLRQEGASGHKKINEYTRYLTVPLCIIQALMFMRMAALDGYTYPGMHLRAIIMGVLGMTAGTIFLMWLGEQIDEYGIGNGISLIIMAGILARMPAAVIGVIEKTDLRVASEPGTYGILTLVFLVAAFVLVVAGAILITQGQRRIPIQQAKQMRGHRMYGGARHYLPLRVNHGGVMPIIFASSLMMFPPIILQQLARIEALGGSVVMQKIMEAFRPMAYTYNVVYIVLIFVFAYFWTTVQFQPKDMAKNLRDRGSFIPGLRPGYRTAEYLETVMIRITYFGAAFLAIIAVVPSVVTQIFGVDYITASFLGGTGLLIVVSVSLDLVQRIEANLLMRNYEGFSSAGRIKGAYS
ncbi:MAG TPA: preprotein translocase subunit SecY, partial [Anaerohalosphaeraceae bacterium]|nr:preprotein translocase subunit SecY [Anaerohalosphaeraceae bacterium]